MRRSKLVYDKTDCQYEIVTMDGREVESLSPGLRLGPRYSNLAVERVILYYV